MTEEIDTLPREGAFMYDLMHKSYEENKKKISQFKFWNKWFVTPLYRINLLPFFGMGKIFALLYHVGRKSGKEYITPVEIRERDNKLYVFASRGERTDWYRNIRENPDKTRVKKGFSTFKPSIRFPEVDERIEVMQWYATTYQTAASKLFGWKRDDEVTDEVFTPLAKFIRIIEFTRN